MSVNLNFGVAGFVAVQDTKGRDLYRKPVNSKEEAQQWVEANKASVQGWGTLKSSFVPVRTDNCGDLSKDLFLPTFINYVLKIENVFVQVIASIFVIPWDVITLSFRLISLPIRMYSQLNSATLPQKLPVHGLIETSPHFKEAMTNGIVHLVTHVEDVQVMKTFGDSQPDTIDQAVKDLPFEAIKHFHDTSCEVVLKELPWLQTRSQSNYSRETYMRSLQSGKWNVVDSRLPFDFA